MTEATHRERREEKKGEKGRECVRSKEKKKPNVQLDLGFLLEGILGDRLEGLFDVDGFLGRGLKVRNVALGLAPRHGSLLRNLKERDITRRGGEREEDDTPRHRMNYQGKKKKAENTRQQLRKE